MLIRTFANSPDNAHEGALPKGSDFPPKKLLEFPRDGESSFLITNFLVIGKDTTFERGYLSSPDISWPSRLAKLNGESKSGCIISEPRLES